MPGGGPGSDNKTLVATCVACGKEVPAVGAVGVLVRQNGRQMIQSVCRPCYDKGWRPEGYAGF